MKGTIVFLVAILMMVAAVFLGDLLALVFGPDQSFWTVFLSMAGVTAAVTIAWFGAHHPSLKRKDEEYTAALVLKKEITSQSNADTFTEETSTGNGTKTNTKRKTGNYDLKLDKAEEEKKPSFVFNKKWLGVLFWLGLLCIYGACSYSFDQYDTEESTHQTVWNAENIPLPHLTDGRLYVSNPDTLIAQESVDSVNLICQQLDQRLGIESAIIIVRHVENEDAFRVAQGIGNKYGVGKKETNRGLVVVVAYDDHRYFIAPGRGLEADLTDAECNRLAVNYLKPYMRANDPDNAMKKLMGDKLHYVHSGDEIRIRTKLERILWKVVDREPEVDLAYREAHRADEAQQEAKAVRKQNDHAAKAANRKRSAYMKCHKFFAWATVACFVMTMVTGYKRK